MLATLVIGASSSAVGVYLLPLAEQAGLSPGVGRLAVTISLIAQLGGGALAALVAGRVGYFIVFVAGGLVSGVVWAIYGFTPSAFLFLAATAVGGVVVLFVAPFLVPMTIEADPSRRAAVQSGAAQLLSGALGPLLASFVVSEHDAHGALWLAGAFMALGLALSASLHFTASSPLAGALDGG